jgi:hypothetical protein
MKKLIILLLVVSGLIYSVTQVSAKQGLSIQDFIKKTFVSIVQKNGKPVSKTPESSPVVLGETDEVKDGSQTQSIGQKIGNTISPVLTTVGNTLESIVEQSSKVVAGKDQKIEIDKAIEDARKKAENLPEDVFNKAKYEYCKQVVTDYEKR